ncbi:lanthionine synthetase C family protein [Streptomyces xanthochromogenes]|uniref:lanthionine synthetase C family protein n=1 Tax=Streptomyces xanthochromogenes TaxID=67384 RepID=UPI00341AA83E
MDLRESARIAADTIADRLASPHAVRGLGHRQGWWPQSLAHGAVGVALLHIERARIGYGSWRRAHEWLACAAAEPAAGGMDSHLYYGAPALAFALHAAAGRPGRYARALNTLDRIVTSAIRDRLALSHARMDRGGMPALAEFDAIRGLSGLGALLLHRDVHTDVLRGILEYLVRLAEPVKHEGELLPGWWTHLAPSGRTSPDYPEGHANNGIAHGIGGPLAVLALAACRGVTVDGQLDAISGILAWFDRWQQDSPAGLWWPYWITREQLRSGMPGHGPSRPSWCYGTAGLARTQQLAALALHDTARQRRAETALLHAMSDPAQLSATVDVSLCHGFAGLVHTTQLAAVDAVTPGLAECLPQLLAPLTGASPAALAASLIGSPGGGDTGFLEGAAGVALALHSFHTGTPSASGWDTCLLIN